MLHALTLLPLVAPAAPLPHAAPDASADGLLSSVPATAVLCVHATNPQALVASRATSDWVAFAMDARWELVVQDLAPILFDDEAWAAGVVAEFMDTRATAIELLADCTSAVLYVDMPAKGSEPTIGLLARGGERLADMARGLVGSDGAPIELAAGVEAVAGERGRAEVFARRGDLVLLHSAPSQDAARAATLACLERVGAAEVAGPLGLAGVAAERRPAALEFAVDLGPLWNRLEAENGPFEGMGGRAFQAVSSMGWVYGAASLGTGERSTWELVVPYGTETLLGQALGFFGEANTALLAEVPAGMTSATVGSFDVAGLVDWGLDRVREVNETLHTRVMGGFDAASGAVGIDVLDDVLRNFTGDFLMFQRPAMMRFGEVEVPGNAPTAVAFVRDADAFVDAMDVVLDLTGVSSGFDSGSRGLGEGQGEMETWRSVDEAPAEMLLAAGAGRVLLSLEPAAADGYLDLASGADGTRSMLTDAALARAAADASGSLVTVQHTAAVADVIEQYAALWREALMEIDRTFAGFDPDGEGASGAQADPMTEVTAAAQRIAGMIRGTFEGTTTTELHASGGQLRLVVRTR